MTANSTSVQPSVLICGASIAGPALAYWLDRYGFDITVVECAKTVRRGGYPIDIRGAAIDVVEHMGLLAGLKAAHIDTRTLRIVDFDGKLIATVAPEDLAGGQTDRHIELPRGELAAMLFDLTRDGRVRYRFADTITSLRNEGAGVEVRFANGDEQRFDIVIGADGMHSHVRALTFGPEAPFSRYLGFCFNIFSIPNAAGLSHEAVISAEPGRSAGVYAVGDGATLQAFLNFAADEPPFRSPTDATAQRQRTAAVFEDAGSIPTKLLAAMQSADDLYFDTVSQIHLPCWSSGRVALAGDAAHAPSFLTGQGTSPALVGAYVLAGELATHLSDPTAAFTSYERIVRPFAEANQALAMKGGGMLMPRTQQELDARDAALTAMQEHGRAPARADESRRAHNLIELPEYKQLVRR